METKHIIVTGAASGVGRACTELLLAQQVKIAAMDVRSDEIAASFTHAADRVFPIALDLADAGSCRHAVATAIERLGHIDTLLHFAAVWTGSTWEESDEAEWTRILAVNLTGTFVLTKSVAEHMVSRHAGSIVLTASDSTKVGGVAGGPAYVASKGGVIALTRSLARALGPRGVRVNAINPGVIETPMTSSWSKEVKRGAIERTPLGRIAQPDDIADVACFLASEQARFITGEVVEVNGGFYFG
jgi:NAD(P)-dependent dehydrogenase (short-subunit alcohol dehydrogenase family)